MDENKSIDMETIKGEIELPTLDVTKYIGKKAKIEQVHAYEDSYNGKTTYNVKLSTSVVDTIGQGNDKIQLRASKLFGMQKDANGKLGWGKDTKLGAFMTLMKAKQLTDLAGKEVIIQTQLNAKNKKSYLTF